MKPHDDIDISAIQAELDKLPGINRKQVAFTAEHDAALRYAKSTGRTWAGLEKWWKAKYGWGCVSTLARRWVEIKDE